MSLVIRATWANRRGHWSGCVGMLVLLALVAVGLTPRSSTRWVKVTVREYRLTTAADGALLVTGTAVNATNRTLLSADLYFILYDVAGRRVGEAHDVALEIPPRGTWDFEAYAVPSATRAVLHKAVGRTTRRLLWW